MRIAYAACGGRAGRIGNCRFADLSKSESDWVNRSYTKTSQESSSKSEDDWLTLTVSEGTCCLQVSFLSINYRLSGSCVLRKFTAGQLAGTIFLLPIKNHMVRRALKLQRTCRPLTINEPYRQACGMALEKYFQQKNCPRQSPLQRCRASRRFLFLSTHHKLSSPAAGAEGIHKWSVSVLREEKIFGRPFPRKRLSSKRSAFKPFSMMN